MSVGSRDTLPRAGEPLAAYRSALAKVEPGEAFLARTRQALTTAGKGTDTAGLRAGTMDAGEDHRRSRGRTLSDAGEDPAGRPRPGMSRETRRLWAGVPARRLLPAVCLALVLAALPVTALMGWRAGGTNLSSGAAAQDMAESVTADTAAAESAPAAAAAAPAAGESMEEAAARDRSDAGEDGAVPGGDAPREEEKSGGSDGHDGPEGGEDGAAEDETALESSPALMETGEPPAAALAALRSGAGWRNGAPGGYDPEAVEVLGWSGSEIVFAGPDPEPAVCFWVREPDGGTCLVFVPRDG